MKLKLSVICALSVMLGAGTLSADDGCSTCSGGGRALSNFKISFQPAKGHHRPWTYDEAVQLWDGYCSYYHQPQERCGGCFSRLFHGGCGNGCGSQWPTSDCGCQTGCGGLLDGWGGFSLHRFGLGGCGDRCGGGHGSFGCFGQLRCRLGSGCCETQSQWPADCCADGCGNVRHGFALCGTHRLGGCGIFRGFGRCCCDAQAEEAEADVEETAVEGDAASTIYSPVLKTQWPIQK